MKTAFLLFSMIAAGLVLTACSAGTDQMPIKPTEDKLTFVFFYADN